MAGSSDDTSQPAPNAMSPAATGLPRVWRRTAAGASCTAPAAVAAASWTVPAADDAASCTDEAADEAVPDTRSVAVDAADRTLPPTDSPDPWRPYGSLPMTFSFNRVAASRARSTRRSTILPGVTFSVRASTSWLSAAWVRSISRRICSGSLEVVTDVLLPRP